MTSDIEQLAVRQLIDKLHEYKRQEVCVARFIQAMLNDREMRRKALVMPEFVDLCVRLQHLFMEDSP